MTELCHRFSIARGHSFLSCVSYQLGDRRKEVCRRDEAIGVFDEEIDIWPDAQKTNVFKKRWRSLEPLHSRSDRRLQSNGFLRFDWHCSFECRVKGERLPANRFMFRFPICDLTFPRSILKTYADKPEKKAHREQYNTYRCMVSLQRLQTWNFSEAFSDCIFLQCVQKSRRLLLRSDTA